MNNKGHRMNIYIHPMAQIVEKPHDFFDKNHGVYFGI
jgi:hypothetical protein